MPLLQFFRSSVGLKILMALSGLVLFGFVFVHMVGNLQIFMGAKQLDDYGHFLKSQPELLWPFRLTLLAAVAVHIWAGLTLYFDNRKARGPATYESGSKAATSSSWASRSMALSGIIVLAFIIFHILQFTLGWIDPTYLTNVDAEGLPDIYKMVITAFSITWVAIFYVVGVGLLCIHLSHGVQSFWRSLGLTSDAYRPLQIWFARGFAIVIFVGMSAIPVSVQLHLLRLTP